MCGGDGACLRARSAACRRVRTSVRMSTSGSRGRRARADARQRVSRLRWMSLDSASAARRRHEVSSGNAPRTPAAHQQASIAARNAASVLPEPVGAATRHGVPPGSRAHARAWPRSVPGRPSGTRCRRRGENNAGCVIALRIMAGARIAKHDHLRRAVRPNLPRMRSDPRHGVHYLSSRGYDDPVCRFTSSRSATGSLRCTLWPGGRFFERVLQRMRLAPFVLGRTRPSAPTRSSPQ